MEISSISGLTEMGMDDSGFINQWHMNSLEELSLPSLAAALGDNSPHSFSHQSFNVSLENPPPGKFSLKPNSFNASKTDHDHHIAADPRGMFLPNVVSFANPNQNNQMGMLMKQPKEEEAVYLKSVGAFPSGISVSRDSFVNQNYVFKACNGDKRVGTNRLRLSQSQDHIIAERKRREKLSQRFIALSAIVPGLKKMDKASVLGDTIKYLKQLQDRVKTLEEQTREKTMESVVVVKKSQLFTDGESFSSEDGFSKGHASGEPLPEIEARFCDKHVLIRIHCEKRKGVLEKTVAEIEKFHLSVINTSVLTFGCSALDVTIIAQMDSEFSMSVKDLVKNLHSAFQLFM